MTLSNRTFGVEIECMFPSGMDGVSLREYIRTNASVGIRQARRQAPAASYWMMQNDGSVGPYGCEIVSPILSGEAGLAELRRVVAALQSAGCTVNMRCGLHVHFGASDMSPKQVANLMKMYVWFESFFDHIMPNSRRATNNQYIKSNRALFGGYGTDAVNTAFDAIDAAPETVEAMRQLHHHDRYRKLNLENLRGFGKGTVEFRQHSGTVDPDKVENWVRLMDAFVAKALVTRIRPRKVERDLKPVEEMRQLFEMIALDKQVRDFYMARRKEFARLEKAGQPIPHALAA